MRRRFTGERPGWRARVEAQGLLFHALDGDRRYWAEGVYYELSPDEVDALDHATREIQAMCLEAVRVVIAEERYAELGVPPMAVPLIERAWREAPPSIYGRLDLALGPDGVPKLLEYNADTPTSLLEAAVIQWSWLEDCFPALDQYNSMHDRLVATWRSLADRLGPLVYFGHVASVEDEMTIAYLRDTAEQAGLATAALLMQEIGWDGRFVDTAGRPLRALFKLYPWEGLLADEFAPHIAEAPQLRWIEPAWKLLLASKGILGLLWRLFPDHPNLLPAARHPLDGAWVRKPFFGREGSNVTVAANDVNLTTSGPYESGDFVYQAYTELGEHDGLRPVLGSWIIGGEAAGIGIRECAGYVTDNTASFVPHVIA